MIPLLLCLLMSLQAAFGASLEASLPVQELTVGQTVELTVQLTDGQGTGLPDVAHGSGLAVDYQSQGQSVVSVNFQTTRIRRYTYTVSGLTEGLHQLGPITLQVGGQELAVAPVQITVRPRSAAQRSAHDLSVGLSNPAPYVGEVVLYEMRYQRTVDIHARSFELPEFDGFLQDKRVEPEGREYRLEEGGQVAMVEEFWVPLVASGQGERAISPAMLTLQIAEKAPRNGRYNPFFDRTPLRTERLASERLAVEVRPLPEAGRPADFSGLVGTFVLSARPSVREVALGGSVTVDVVLEGNGALTGFELPPLPPESGLRAYDDSPELTAALEEGAYVSRFRQRRAVVPDREGTLVLPSIDLSVFDPAAGAYVRLQTEPVEITVTPGEAAGEVARFSGEEVDRRAEVAALADDILPAPSAARVGDATLSAAWPWALLLGLTPLLGWAGLVGSGLRTRKAEDPRAALRARLGQLPEGDGERLAALEQLFRAAAAARLGIAPPAVDRAALGPLGADAVTLYADLEAARYGGLDVGDVEARVRAFVEAL